jgi:hypothetical protein
VLHSKLQLSQLTKILKVFGLSDLTGMLSVLDGLEKITEDGVRQLAVAVAAEVTSSLMHVLRSPEGTICNIDIECQASAWLTNRGLRLDEVSDDLDAWNWNTYIAEANRWVNTLHSNDDIVKRGCEIALGEEAALD